MFVERIIRLVLVALLTIGLGAGVSVGDTQPFAGTDQLPFRLLQPPATAAVCEDCATPCVASIMCGTACISLGLASTQRVALRRLSIGRLTA